MKQSKNTLPKDFLKQYGKGDKDSTRFIPLSHGFVRLFYTSEGALQTASFVESKRGVVIGQQLEFDVSGGDEITFISENGVSGLQWSDGEVIAGTTYDYDDAGPKPLKKIERNRWVDDMVQEMINQTR